MSILNKIVDINIENVNQYDIPDGKYLIIFSNLTVSDIKENCEFSAILEGDKIYSIHLKKKEEDKSLLDDLNYDELSEVFSKLRKNTLEVVKKSNE